MGLYLLWWSISLLSKPKMLGKQQDTRIIIQLIMADALLWAHNGIINGWIKL